MRYSNSASVSVPGGRAEDSETKEGGEGHGCWGVRKSRRRSETRSDRGIR